MEMSTTVTTTREGVSKDDSKHLLDNDWGAKIPEYVSKGCVATAVFLMGITIRGISLSTTTGNRVFQKIKKF